MQKIRIGFLSETSYFRHFNQFLEGIMESAGKHNVDVIRLMLVPTQFIHHSQQFDLFMELIGRMELSGLIFLGWMRYVGEAELAKTVFGPLKIPFVSLGRCHEGITSVYQNGRKEIAKLIEHAVRFHKLRRIAITHPLYTDDRIDGYRDYMKKSALYDARYEITNNDLGESDSYEFDIRAKKILSVIYEEKKLDPEAIVSLYSMEAAMLMEGLKARGIQAPERVKVLSWEDIEASRYHTVPITALYFPFRELGFTACERLLALIRGKTPPLNTEVPGRLIIRNSCGCHLQSLALVSPVDRKNRTQESAPPASPPLVKETSPAALDLAPAEVRLREAVARKNDDEFIRFVEALLRMVPCSVQDIHNIRDRLLHLRAALQPGFAGNRDDYEMSEAIWLKVQLLLQDKMEQSLGIQEVNLLQQSWYHINMNQSLANSFKFEQIFTVLSSFLKKNRINCYLYALTEQGKCCQDFVLRLAFREGEIIRVPEEDRVFTRFKKIIYLNNEKQQLLFTHLLTVHDELIGVVFFEPGPVNERVYQDLAVQLACSIKSAIVVENLEKVNIELETANQKLAELDKLKNDFIANITHDFRTPLMIILNSSDLGLKYDKESDRQLIRKRYHTIFEASLKLKNTIDKLLELAKMDSLGIKIHACKIPLVSWLEHIAEFYRSATTNTGITITTRFPFRELKNFYSDPEKLEEVVSNIISNAFKFIDPAHGRIELELKELDDCVRIIVSDNGIGIPQDKLEVIFKRFEQLRTDESRPHKGTGLGLAFSRELLSYLQGKIWAESDGPWKGARFIIELKKGKEHFRAEELEDNSHIPLQVQGRCKETYRQIQSDLDLNNKQEAVIMIRELNQDSEFEHRKALIMIIEDHPRIREIELEYLERAGYANFILAQDAYQGIEAAHKYHPDLFICDYNLPGMKGDELHDELLNNPEFRKVPFIFLTALEDKNVIRERKQRGAIAYLVKPVDENDLVLTVEVHLKKYMELRAMMYQAAVDELTGVSNKRYLLQDLKRLLAARSYRNLSVLFFDLDHFKQLNDTYGHVTGDTVLAEIGKLIRGAVRKYDIAGRYGGDEFVILLPDTNAKQAVVVAEKIKEKIEKLVMTVNGTGLRIAASFGIASLIDNQRSICARLDVPDLKAVIEAKPATSQDWTLVNRKNGLIAEILLELADNALYAAKRTTCKQCSHSTAKSEDFKGNKCPVCGSSELDMGRGRIRVAEYA